MNFKTTENEENGFISFAWQRFFLRGSAMRTHRSVHLLLKRKTLAGLYFLLLNIRRYNFRKQTRKRTLKVRLLLLLHTLRSLHYSV